MKLIQTIYLLIFISLISTRIIAQEPIALPEETKPLKKEYYTLCPRMSVTVPHPIANRSFKKSFVGVYELSGGLNYMFYKGLFGGITYKTGFLKVMENKIPDFNAGMSVNNIGIIVGGDHYVGEKNRVIFSAAISTGKNWTHFPSLICKDPVNHPLRITGYTTTYVEPEINLFFLVEPNFGIGATISYTIYNRVFDPFEICFDDWAPFDKNSPGNTQCFSFGFGFYYSLFKKKK